MKKEKEWFWNVGNERHVPGKQRIPRGCYNAMNTKSWSVNAVERIEAI